MNDEVRKMQKIAGIIKEMYNDMEEDLNLSKNNLANTGDEINLAKIIGANQTVSKAFKRIDQPAAELDGAFVTFLNSIALQNVPVGQIRAQLEKALLNLKDDKNKVISAPGATNKNQVNLSKNPVPQIRKTGGLK